MSTAVISSAGFRRDSSELIVPFAISQESLPVAEVVFVRISDTSGHSGLGEASPFPSLTYDTIDDVLTALPMLLNLIKTCTVAQALSKVEEWWTAPQSQSRTAIAAIEMALCDLRARQLGIPLMNLYAKDVDAVLSPYIQTDLTVPIMPPETVAEFLSGFADGNFQVIKIKVGGLLAEDLARIIATRDAMPPGTILTLDGNQGFEVDGVENLVCALKKENIYPAFFEQPLNENDWDGCARLAALKIVPVFLDEAVRFPADLERAANGGLCEGINLKITKSGITHTLRLAQMARALGLDLMIGGMLESEVAMGHSLHLAAGFGGIRWCDLDTPFFFRKRFTANSPWNDVSRLNVPNGPGLGLTLLEPV